MKRIFFYTALLLGGAYVTLHVILGSRPIQTRVVTEIRNRIGVIGYDLEIGSIDFSLLVPRIYFNNVKVSSRKGALISIVPVSIEKIKISFEPLSLLQNKITIGELVFYHPRIRMPHADALYRKIEFLVRTRKELRLEGGDYPITIKTLGVVDATLDIQSQDPFFSVKTNAVTVFLTNSGNRSQALSIESGHIDVYRDGVLFQLSRMLLDLDRSPTSVRVNQAEIVGERLKVYLRGTAPLPLRLDSSGINVSVEASLPLSLLSQIKELALPSFQGQAEVKGSLLWTEKSQTGVGSVAFDAVKVEGYEVGSGTLEYNLHNRHLKLTDIRSRSAGGEATGNLEVQLENNFPIHGSLKVSGLELHALLAAIKTPGVPLRMTSQGTIEIEGSLRDPFRIRANIRSVFNQFKLGTPVRMEENIIVIPGGEIDGTLEFYWDRMDFNTQIKVLGGICSASGVVRFDNSAFIRVGGKGLSLTDLEHIALLKIGGIVNVLTEIDVKGRSVKINGNFETTAGEIANLQLGPVKGNVFYQNALLSFENLMLPTEFEPVLGNGFVDFRPKDTLLRFRVSARRVGTAHVFKVFSKIGLPFETPNQGEISGQLTIDSGHDENGIEVTSQGQAKNFSWYDEKWLSGSYQVTVRPRWINLSKALLLKNSGALEVSGHFEGNKSRLDFKSHGLRAEELSHLGGAPFSGEVHGALTFQGDLSQPAGTGALHVPALSFRQKPLGAADVQMKTGDRGLELDGKFLTGKVKISAHRLKEKSWKLTCDVNDADLGPAVMGLLRKDISSIDSIPVTGMLALTGDLWNWRQMEGRAEVTRLMAVFRGSEMRLVKPVTVVFGDGAVTASSVELKGSDAELKGNLVYDAKGKVDAKLDGKLDLQFVQPFIPFLESGKGQLAAGLRMTGLANQFTLLGNITLDNGTLRLTGLQDEFKSVRAQIGVSHQQLTIEKFDAEVGTGNVVVSGEVEIARFSKFRPRLAINTNRVRLRLTQSLSSLFSGSFLLEGDDAPYMLSGKCRLIDARLTSLEAKKTASSQGSPAFRFDIDCTSVGGLWVETSVFSSQFKGDLKIRGTSDQIGILGTVDANSGTIVFRETKFAVSSANVRFESERAIVPRFTVQSRALVKESSTSQEYEVLLYVLGVSADYKLRLTSTPRLTEPEIISLLVLGVTNRSQEGNYAELGSAIAGQIPVPSKITSELGVDIKLNTQSTKSTSTNTPTDVTVPSVRVEKNLTPKTKLSYSNTLTGSPTREFRIEQMLDDNLTANFSTTNKTGSTTEQPLVQSYGVDIRYRFQFE